MRCDEFESRLNEVLDARESAENDLELSRHASKCAPCAETLAAQSWLWQSLDASHLSPADDFAEAIAAQAVESAGAARRRLANGWAVMALATSLLLLILPTAALLWRSGDGAREQLSGNLASARRMESRSDRSQAAANQIDGSRQSRSPGVPVSQWLEKWRSMPSPLVLTDPQGRLTRGGMVVEQFKGGLEPIANSLSTAFHLLRETLPGFWSPMYGFDDTNSETVHWERRRAIA